MFVKARFAYSGREDGIVPFYLLPQLGGNFDLRGFNQYRFYDNNAFMAALEHRWYVFSGLEAAAFVDAGKTVPEKGHVDFSAAELQRRPRDAHPSPRRGRAADGRRQEPRGCPVDLVVERHLAEEVLVAARRLRGAPPGPRACALRPGDVHRPAPGGGAEVLSRRPAAARTGADASARSGSTQSERAARGDVGDVWPPGRTAPWQERDRGARRQYPRRCAGRPLVREPSRPHAHEPGGVAARQRGR